MEKLKQVLAQEDTVLFVGSGISVWSGLPTWSGFIEELATFVEESVQARIWCALRLSAGTCCKRQAMAFTS